MPGVGFDQAGTLHGQGTFEPLGPAMNPIKLRPDGMSIGFGMKRRTPAWSMTGRAAGAQSRGMPIAASVGMAI
jgi:hypothetical protein